MRADRHRDVADVSLISVPPFSTANSRSISPTVLDLCLGTVLAELGHLGASQLRRAMASSPTDSAPSQILQTNTEPPAPTHHVDTSRASQHHHSVPGLSRLRRLSHRARRSQSSLQQYQAWEQPGGRLPYHEYVHQLVLSGWDSLQDLDEYMKKDIEDQGLVISVLDITNSYALVRRPDIPDRESLNRFLEEDNRDGVRVRLYMAEQRGNLAAGVMEAFGSSLSLDPRFFAWSIRGKYGVAPLAPSQRHRAPFMSIGFGVPLTKTPSRTDAENFRVSVYIHQNAGESRWTGIILFNSHTTISLSHRTLIRPPAFNQPIPPPNSSEPKSFRELYIESFEDLELDQATTSPFYTIHFLLRLNCYCWSQVITSIRNEDRRINGISDTSVGHVEEIKKSLSVVERGGSLGWDEGDSRARKSKESLVEDFKHLVEQTDLLWQNRDKMAAIRQRKSEARRTALVNSFTYIFAPITIMSGIYGMNVSQISGSNQNPNIWQFFVAVSAMNILMVCTLAASAWVQSQYKTGRAAGWKEALGFAVGNVNTGAGKRD